MSVPSGMVSAFSESRRQLWVARASVLAQAISTVAESVQYRLYLAAHFIAFPLTDLHRSSQILTVRFFLSSTFCSVANAACVTSAARPWQKP